MNASASGDTILIGPGRYPELHSYTTPGGGWTGDVLVSIDDRDLTLIGMGPEITVIGLEENPGTPLWPIAVAMVWEDRTLNIRDLSIENVYNGVYIYGSMDVRATMIRGCDIGLGTFDCPEIYVEDCEFANLDDIGILSYSGTSLLRLYNTSFSDIPKNISTYGVESLLVGCVFSYSNVGGGFYDGSSAVVQDCEFTAMYQCGVYSGYYSLVDIVDCTIEGGTLGCIWTSSNGEISGSGNELIASSGPAILAATHSSMALHGSHILSPANNFVELDDYFEAETYYLDLTDNFWGVATTAEISAGIWDGHDDPEINAFVLFDPFSGDPIGNEDMSWGELKLIYDR